MFVSFFFVSLISALHLLQILNLIMDQDNSVQSDLIGMSRGGVGEKAFVTKTATLTGKQANVRGKKICVNSTYTISFINTDGGFDFAKFIFSLDVFNL